MHTTFADLVYSKQVFYSDKRSLVKFSLSILFFGGIIWSTVRGDDRLWQCKEYTKNDLLVADCSNQNKEMYIPNDLNPKIQVLNLSGNMFVHCDNQSFDRYKETLMVLDLSYSYTIQLNIIELGCFAELVNLRSLNLSHTCLPMDEDETTYYVFPSAINLFTYESCPTHSIDLTDIEELEEFHARDSEFLEFPRLDEFTPVKYIDLRGSPLTLVEPFDIAPFCLLRELLIEIKDNEGIHEPDLYCHCVKLNSWLSSVKVKYNKLNCSSPQSQPPPCYADAANSNARAKHEDCLKRTAGKGGVSPLFIWIMIVIALLVLTTTVLVFFYLHWRKVPKPKKDESKISIEPESSNASSEAEEAEAAETAEEAETAETAEEAETAETAEAAELPISKETQTEESEE